MTSPTATTAFFICSALAAVTFLVLAVRGLLHGFLRLNVGGFLTKSFCDSLGAPDAGRLTQFLLAMLLAACIITGLATNKWAPDYLIISLLAAVTGQSVAGAWENRGKQSSDAAVVQAGLTGQPAPGPATARTTTTTTVGLTE